MSRPKRHHAWIALGTAALVLMLPWGTAGAQAMIAGGGYQNRGRRVGQSYSLTFQILILMTALTLLPAILLAMTAFTRIIIVLSILRQAIGMPTTPSNQVLTGLGAIS